MGKKVRGKEQPTTEGRKRQLVDVVISVGEPMDLCGEGQKKRLNGADVLSQIPEGVLDDQHLLPNENFKLELQGVGEPSCNSSLVKAPTH